MGLRRCAAFLVGFVGLLAGFARAQSPTYVEPQTQQQTLATGLACSGTQTYAIKNFGQTQHYLSIAGLTGAAKFQAEIDGIDTQGNLFRISDILEFAGGTSTRQGTIKGAGYYPQIQVAITCSPGTATYTASYSGTWGTFDNSVGSYLTAQIDKINFFAANATVNQQDNFQTPFGSSAGTLFFQFNTSSVAGSTLAISCNGNGSFASTFPLAVNPANTTALQVFQVPDNACPFAQVAYTSTGGGTTVTAEYIFAVPGISSHANTDPCQSGAIAKTSLPVSVAAAATTQVIAATTANSIYVCGWMLSQAATAGTVQWVYGTGTNCATGTNNVTGAIPVTASSPEAYTGPGYVTKVPVGNALCLTTTGAGGTAAGIITFVQSP